MKQFLFVLISILFIDLIFQQCANPVNPTGGPKDTLAPVYTYSNPTIGQLNFKNQTLTLNFDEYINADKIQQNLIITPKSNVKYKHTIKKNKIEIVFDEPFQDSTTYSLNFFDGITDITEKNPAENLTLAFSTGPYIDSMKVSGTAKNLFTQEPSKNFTVGLYPINDTLNYLTDNPIYFTSTNQEGNFNIEYIKSGKYKIISFYDDNKNLLLDPETEEHGFLSDTLHLFTNDSIKYHIRTQLINIKPIKYINARPTAQYIEVKYSREIDTYSILPKSTNSILTGEKKDGIKIYKPNSHNFTDSIQFIITAMDSLSNSTLDTINTIFLESNRDLPALNYTILTPPNKELQNNQKIKLRFNKPIQRSDSLKFSFIKDSTFTYSVTPSLNWNANRTEVEILTYINTDTLFSKLKNSIPQDTTKLDTISIDSITQINIPFKPQSKTTNKSIQFQIAKSAFISIENDTTTRKTILFKAAEKESTGSVNITLSTNYENFIIQLLSSNGDIKYQMSNTKSFSFSKVKSGNYAIRILIDTNNDGNWSYGNILRNEEPEIVYIHPEETSVRENWILDLEISF